MDKDGTWAKRIAAIEAIWLVVEWLREVFRGLA